MCLCTLSRDNNVVVQEKGFKISKIIIQLPSCDICLYKEDFHKPPIS